MSETESEYPEPADSPNKSDDPTGSLSVRDENDLDFGSGHESPRLARKRHGAVLDSQRGPTNQMSLRRHHLKSLEVIL